MTRNGMHTKGGKKEYCINDYECQSSSRTIIIIIIIIIINIIQRVSNLEEVNAYDV